MDVKAIALSLAGAHMDYKEEWQWERFLVDTKMFAACLDKGDGPMITLKVKPEDGIDLRLRYPESIIEGYYMNKIHWITIYPERLHDDVLLEALIKASYALVVSSFSKKKQLELGLNPNALVTKS